jgi:hypothetical protein
LYYRYPHILHLAHLIAKQGVPVSSEAKTAANRANALKSTGPRTTRGKTKSGFNAVTHGIYARTSVLPGEDENAYREMEKSLQEFFKPVGPVEHMLVRQSAVEAWRLARIDRAAIALHVRLRDAEIIRCLQSMSPSEVAYTRSAYKDELKSQLKEHQHLHDAACRNRWSNLNTGFEDPAAGAHALDTDEKKDVAARLSRVLEVDGTILTGMIPSTESAPQACLDRERRATVRIYLGYVEKLIELQERRLTVTLLPSPMAENKAIPMVSAKRAKPLPPSQPANQNHLGSDNKGTEKSASGVRARRQIRKDQGGMPTGSGT